jgi:hypothetical protein
MKTNPLSGLVSVETHIGNIDVMSEPQHAAQQLVAARALVFIKARFHFNIFDRAAGISDNEAAFWRLRQNGSLAQLVEQWTLNPLVESSSLSRPTR